MLLAGLGVLVWFGWQVVGTTVLSHRAQREVLDSLDKEWASGASTAHTDHGQSRAVVRIPRFGTDYRVPVIEGTTQTALASGLGHETDSAEAGQPGNYVLAGHRVTHGEPFRDFPDLRPGDQVVVETSTTTYVYELTNAGTDLEVPFSATWVQDPAPVNPDPRGPQPPAAERLITLTTCAELFHTDERLVVFGELVSSAPR